MAVIIRHYPVVLIACLCAVEGAKILLMPTMFSSLVLEGIVVGETLVDRGHDVYALIDLAWKDLNLIQGGKVKPIFYTKPSLYYPG